MSKRIVVIGATSAIAQACSRLWCSEESPEFVLVGRDRGKLQAVANDLEVRNADAVTQVCICNFLDEREIQALAKSLGEQGRMDIVLVAHGTLPEQLQCQQDLVKAKDAMTINGLSPAYFAEAFAGQLEKQNSGALVVIGSVAGDRGRQSNYVYGASKGLVERYVQGLQHRLAGTGVQVTLVKPGPTQTPMTAKMDGHEKMAPVEEVASCIINGVRRGKSTIYAPTKWALIMFIIKHLPRFIFNRMKI